MDTRPCISDFTGKLNYLNCELQGKGKTVSDMIDAVSAFRANMNIFSVPLQRKKLLRFPSVQSVLNDNTSASRALDRALEKYS